MLSRWQRWLTISLSILTLGMVVLAGSFGGGVPGMLAAASIVPVGYAAALGLEFLMMHAVNRSDPAPRARPAQVLRAWVGEVISGPVVFGWRQPWHSARWPDGVEDAVVDRSSLPGSHPVSQPGAVTGLGVVADATAVHGPPAFGRCGVLFVHGFVCSRGLWNPWMSRLAAAGTPFVALDLAPVFGSIDEYVPLVEAGVRRLEAATGRPPIVVAHSMGGLALRRWWADQDPLRARLHHAITIGTPHGGTWLARFAFTHNGRQMRLDGDWIRELRRLETAAGRSPPWSGRLTCFYGHCDNIVFPASTATLAGADNRHLAAVAHVHMADRREPFDALQALLADS